MRAKIVVGQATKQRRSPRVIRLVLSMLSKNEVKKTALRWEIEK